jgi:predicted acylesterase/phospholipase RssA
VTGAVYEIGCLRALEELLDRSVLDFDTYVGVSGGAFIASLLAAGISPHELYGEITADWRRPKGVSADPLFRLGVDGLLRSTARAPRVLGDALRSLLRGERRISELALSLLEALPAGLLDNSGVQEWVAQLYKLRGLEDHFDELHRELFIVAVDLDSGEAMAFGERPHRGVRISRAVQASTALPGLYRPVRIAGHDYVDGGVKKTAHVNLAIEHGADLVVCINPIVPILNESGGPLKRHLSEKGISYVLDQVFRIALHGRMQYGLERYAAEHPEVDILLIEPSRNDMRMFSTHIMRMSDRRVVAAHGYRSALASLGRRRAAHARMLRRHGIRLRRPSESPEAPPPSRYRSELARQLAGGLDFLEGRLRAAGRR